MADNNQNQNQANQQGAAVAPSETIVSNVEVVEDTPEAVTKRREAEQAKLAERQAADQAANQGQSGQTTTTSKTTVVKQNQNQDTNK